MDLVSSTNQGVVQSVRRPCARRQPDWAAKAMMSPSFGVIGTALATTASRSIIGRVLRPWSNQPVGESAPQHAAAAHSCHRVRPALSWLA